MKNMKLKTLILSLGLITSVAHAGKGGAGDGGGNVRKEPFADREQIKEWLVQTKEILPFVLRNIEVSWFVSAQHNYDMSAYGIKDAKAVYERLFTGPHSLFAVLEKSKFVPLEKGGCETVGGSEADASALKENVPNICFSMDNLETKLKVKSGKPKLVALAVHEIFHEQELLLKLDYNEDLANFIQDMVERSISEKILSVSGMARTFQDEFTDLIDNSNYARQDLQSSSRNETFCRMWVPVSAAAGKIVSHNLETGSTLGIMVFDSKRLGQMLGAAAKAANISALCYMDHEFQPGGKYASLFGDKPRISLEEYLKNQSKIDGAGTTNIQFPVEGKIRRVKLGDRRAALLEVDEVIALFKSVAEQAK